MKTIDETKQNIEKLQQVGTDIKNIVSSGASLIK
jgi:hypothetical protein